MSTPHAHRRARPPCRRHQRGGFTLVELLIVVAIIGLLSTLAFVVLARSIKEARRTLERQSIVSIRDAVESYKQDFGFLPPLVYDGDPYNPATNTPNIRSDAFLRSAQMPIAPRYTVFSLPYYIFGMLGVDADGVDGPGNTEPLRDGSFTRVGREFGPRMDISRDPGRMKRSPTNPALMMYVDRWGKAATNTAGWPPVNPIRYYRWLPAFDANGKVEQYLTPRVCGDPNTDFNLRDAQYAIVSVGPDGVTDERMPLPTAGKIDQRVLNQPILGRVTADDIVEVGK